MQIMRPGVVWSSPRLAIFIKPGIIAFQTLPVIVGIVVVVSTALVITYVYTKKNKRKKTLVDSTAKVSLKLIEKDVISHDTTKFRFELPTSEHTLGSYQQSF